MKNILFLINLLLLSTCYANNYDIVDIQQLVSSKGESIYIVSVTWGVTGDYQLTSITKNKNKFTQSRDTINTINGLNPFEYRFINDTLTLYFRNEVSYIVEEQFNTISINYKVMDSDYYQRRDSSYHNVPGIEVKNDPNMPRPSSNK